ncbi:hypothetical protein IHE31_10265 [Mycetohabitans rhizoxinica]
MRINDMLDPTSVPPRAHEGKQKEANVQPSNVQSHARLGTLGDQDGRVTKRKKSADPTRSMIKQMSGRFALKSSSQAGAMVSSNKTTESSTSGINAVTQETPIDTSARNVGADTGTRTVTTGTETTGSAEQTTKRATDSRNESTTAWLATKVAAGKAGSSDPAFSVLNLRPKQRLTRSEELINTYLQRSSNTKSAKYVTQLRHFSAWAKKGDPSREPLDDVLNLELTPKNQPVINAWRNARPNPYAREGYAAFNDFRATYGKTVDPRKEPPPRYDTMVSLDDT